MKENDQLINTIADESTSTVMQAISVANSMGLITDQDSLRELIKAGITDSLETLASKLAENEK